MYIDCSYIRVLFIHSSPARQKSVDKVIPPQRPPPPKIKAFASQQELGINFMSSVQTPLDVNNKKPKPPIRTRKKKYITEDLQQNSRQSEFVELSTSDAVVEYQNQDEVRVVEQVEAMKVEEPKMDTLTEDRLLEEKEEITEGYRQEDSKTVREIELDKDDWEVISDSAADEESRHVIMDEPCLQPNG